MLSDFLGAFGPLLCHIAGKVYPQDFSPTKFMWYDELGIDKASVAEGWELIKSNPQFWADLKPTDNGLKDLELANKLIHTGHDVYFVTARPFKGAKAATEEWLFKHGIQYPTVLLCDAKGPAARSLKLTHFLDDKVDNCYDVLRHCGTRCNTYLMDRSWNKQFLDIYVPKVNSLEDILKKEKIHVEGD